MFKTPAKMKPQAMSLCPNAFSKSEDFLGKKPEVPNSGEKPLLCTSENFGWFPVLFFSEYLMFSVGIVNGIIIFFFTTDTVSYLYNRYSRKNTICRFSVLSCLGEIPISS